MRLLLVARTARAAAPGHLICFLQLFEGSRISVTNAVSKSASLSTQQRCDLPASRIARQASSLNHQEVFLSIGPPRKLHKLSASTSHKLIQGFTCNYCGVCSSLLAQYG